MSESTDNPRTGGSSGSNWSRSDTFKLVELLIAVVALVATVVSVAVAVGGRDGSSGGAPVVSPPAPSTDISSPPVTGSTPTTDPGEAQSVPTTEPASPGAAGSSSTSVASPKVTVKIKSGLTSGTHEVGESRGLAKVYSASPRGHDGRATVTTSDEAVCRVSAGQLVFVGAGKCTVSVALPETARYRSSSKKFSVTVLERGLTAEQIDQLSGFAFNDANNAAKGLDSYISYGRFLRNVSLGVKDLRKTWRLKGSIQMPNLAAVECLSVHVRYSYQGQFSFTGDTQATTATSCAGKTGSFEFCREFNPSKGRSTFPALPADDSQSVSYDWINWGLVWKSTPVDHPGAAASPPGVRVTDVRPGSCS